MDIKVTQLKMTVAKTDNVIEGGKSEAIERQCSTLKSITAEINRMRLEVEAKKLGAKVDVTDIEAWNAQLDAQLEKADSEVEKVCKWLDERKKEAEIIAQEEQLKFEEKLQRAKLKLKTELQAEKTSSQNSHQTASSSSVQAKLPKLVITKFDGSYMDWPRFWGQFSETIDKTSVAPITKFSYLRELVDSKVKGSIEALPFTAEGYNRAISILKDKYGKESEITKAYTREILDLPTVTNANPKKISEFSETLNYCVQALQTLNKLEQVNGAVSMTLDKLPGIRGDLVRTDPDWERWDFAQLSEAIRLWVRRNPVDTKTVEREIEQQNRKRERSNKLFQARGQEHKSKECVYCGDANHKPSECEKIISIDERKQTLARKNLCFNCATPNHRAAECFSKATCQNCRKRHHTSICDRKQNLTNQENGRKTLMTASENNEGVLPVIAVKVDGIICRALIDTGAGSSYASAKLIDLLEKKPCETKMKRVDMLMSSQVTKLEMYNSLIESIDGSFRMNVKLTKVNKGELLTVDNPKYQQLINNHSHLKGIEIKDRDTKQQLPVHVVLGSGEYARIKTETKPHIGKDGDPIAEKTKLGWFIMSPGQEFDHNRMLLTQTSQTDYEELCRLDILGLADSSEHDQQTVYSEFKEQLVRNKEGWYETGLPWRGNHPLLHSNKQGSLRRLYNLNKMLEREGLTTEYNQIIQEQKEEGIIEQCSAEPAGREFYIPHKPVIRKKAATTKLRVVYDASARASTDAPSLNECLYPGPALQNKLWDVLVRQRFYPVAIFGDIQKAFLQIRIKEQERDALRFHWRVNEHSDIETYRFTRALFGLTCSPFLLGGVIEQHLESWENKMPETVAALRKGLYVDDLLSGGLSVEQARERKSSAIEIFNDARFVLHKWGSNVTELEDTRELEEVDNDLSFAKQQVGAQPSESKVLGMPWDKKKDTLTVTFTKNETPKTKREVLRNLAKVYDPLGLVTPLTLQGKLIFRDICANKLPWDADMGKPLIERVKKWEENLPTEETVPRPVVDHREPVLSLELHAFGDASTQGVGAAVYAVVRQQTGTTQRLVAAKGRLAKQGLTLPRLELISAHMVTNLVTNVRNTLDGLPNLRVYAWLDSTVALHWIMGNSQYKQFVTNWVNKII